MKVILKGAKTQSVDIMVKSIKYSAVPSFSNRMAQEKDLSALQKMNKRIIALQEQIEKNKNTMLSSSDDFRQNRAWQNIETLHERLVILLGRRTQLQKAEGVAITPFLLECRSKNK